MKKNSDKFDEMIRGKLSRLEVEYDPKSWDAFEQKLNAGDQAEVEDAWLDGIVFDKLNELEPANAAPQWERMSAKLDREVAIRRQQLSRRVIEAALVMLILFTFVQYFGEQTPERFFGKATAYENADNDHVAAQSADATSDISPNQNQALNARTNNTDTEAATPIITSPPETPPANRAIAESAQNEHPLLPGIAVQAERQDAEPLALPHEAGLPGEFSDEHFQRDRLETLAALDQLDTEALENDEAHDPEWFIEPLHPQHGFYVSMFGSADYNQIVTPPYMVEGQLLEGFDRYELGYGGGLMASWEMGRWEIGSGLIYTAKEYTPRPLLYIYDGNFRDGYAGEGFRLVELNMIQLPFNLRYNLIRYDKWRAYTTVGLSLHLTMQANYYTATEAAFNRPAAIRPPSQNLTGGNVSSPVDEKARILSEGLLDGGSLMRNSYMTGNIGFGLERFMNERWSVFAQPTYHHSFRSMRGGIGPDGDQINTMSIFMGIRVKLRHER
jgi:hypothetical protein